jgi:Ca2+-binding RTX toxin-like protein
LVDDNTFQGYTIMAGTDNADQLIGTANKDLILGLDGDDKIQGSGADDIICGGNGQDHLVGDSYPNVGQDHLLGGSYPDVIISQPGTLGKDFIFGQEGNDIINSNEELERDYGDPGDILYGGPGDDAVTGNDGNDKLSGGDGNDNLDAGDGKDQLDGGPGDDGCYDNQVETIPIFLNCEDLGDPPVTVWKKPKGQ